jgi:hypothetical protein
LALSTLKKIIWRKTVLISHNCQQAKSFGTATIAKPLRGLLMLAPAFTKICLEVSLKIPETNPYKLSVTFDRVQTVICLAKFLSQNAYFFGCHTEKVVAPLV